MFLIEFLIHSKLTKVKTIYHGGTPACRLPAGRQGRQGDHRGMFH